MKFTIERDDFLAAVDAAAKVAGGITLFPITSCVRVTTDGSQILVAAHALDHSLVTKSNATIEVAGEICIPAINLASLLKRMPMGGQIKVALDGPQVRLSCGRSRYALPTMLPDSFPSPLVAGEDAASFVLTPEEAAECFTRTAPFLDTDKTRPYTCGVYIGLKTPTTLVAVATNGKQLFMGIMEAPGGSQGRPGGKEKPGKAARRGVIVPREAM